MIKEKLLNRVTLRLSGHFFFFFLRNDDDDENHFYANSIHAK